LECFKDSWPFQNANHNFKADAGNRIFILFVRQIYKES